MKNTIAAALVLLWVWLCTNPEQTGLFASRLVDALEGEQSNVEAIPYTPAWVSLDHSPAATITGLQGDEALMIVFDTAYVNGDAVTSECTCYNNTEESK